MASKGRGYSKEYVKKSDKSKAKNWKTPKKGKLAKIRKKT